MIALNAIPLYTSAPILIKELKKIINEKTNDNPKTDI
jgi:hypothetical protein